MMKYFVTSGAIEKTIHHDSPEEAAILFLETVDGPFGVLIAVDRLPKRSKSETQWFHTKTLLKEIETHNQRILTLHEETA